MSKHDDDFDDRFEDDDPFGGTGDFNRNPPMKPPANPPLSPSAQEAAKTSAFAAFGTGAALRGADAKAEDRPVGGSGPFSRPSTSAPKPGSGSSPFSRPGASSGSSPFSSSAPALPKLGQPVSEPFRVLGMFGSDVSAAQIRMLFDHLARLLTDSDPQTAATAQQMLSDFVSRDSSEALERAYFALTAETPLEVRERLLYLIVRDPSPGGIQALVDAAQRAGWDDTDRALIITGIEAKWDALDDADEAVYTAAAQTDDDDDEGDDNAAATPSDATAILPTAALIPLLSADDLAFRRLCVRAFLTVHRGRAGIRTFPAWRDPAWVDAAAQRVPVEPDQTVRRVLAETLAGHRLTLEQIQGLIGSDDPAVRWWGVKALFQSAVTAPQPDEFPVLMPDQAQWETIITQIMADADEAVVCAALSGLAKGWEKRSAFPYDLQFAYPLVGRAISQGSEEIRLHALAAFTKYAIATRIPADEPQEELVRWLLPILQPQTVAVEGEAPYLTYNTPVIRQALAALRVVLLRPHFTPFPPDIDLIGTLRGVIDSRYHIADRPMQIAALEIIGGYPPDDPPQQAILNLLIGVIQGRSGAEVRQAAIRALGRFGSHTETARQAFLRMLFYAYPYYLRDELDEVVHQLDWVLCLWPRSNETEEAYGKRLRQNSAVTADARRAGLKAWPDIADGLLLFTLVGLSDNARTHALHILDALAGDPDYSDDLKTVWMFQPLLHGRGTPPPRLVALALRRLASLPDEELLAYVELLHQMDIDRGSDVYDLHFDEETVFALRRDAGLTLVRRLTQVQTGDPVTALIYILAWVDQPAVAAALEALAAVPDDRRGEGFADRIVAALWTNPHEVDWIGALITISQIDYITAHTAFYRWLNDREEGDFPDLTPVLAQAVQHFGQPVDLKAAQKIAARLKKDYPLWWVETAWKIRIDEDALTDAFVTTWGALIRADAAHAADGAVEPPAESPYSDEFGLLVMTLAFFGHLPPRFCETLWEHIESGRFPSSHQDIPLALLLLNGQLKALQPLLKRIADGDSSLIGADDENAPLRAVLSALHTAIVSADHTQLDQWTTLEGILEGEMKDDALIRAVGAALALASLDGQRGADAGLRVLRSFDQAVLADSPVLFASLAYFMRHTYNACLTDDQRAELGDWVRDHLGQFTALELPNFLLRAAFGDGWVSAMTLKAFVSTDDEEIPSAGVVLQRAAALARCTGFDEITLPAIRAAFTRWQAAQAAQSPPAAGARLGLTRPASPKAAPHAPFQAVDGENAAWAISQPLSEARVLLLIAWLPTQPTTLRAVAWLEQQYIEHGVDAAAASVLTDMLDGTLLFPESELLAARLLLAAGAFESFPAILKCLAGSRQRSLIPITLHKAAQILDQRLTATGDAGLEEELPPLDAVAGLRLTEIPPPLWIDLDWVRRPTQGDLSFSSETAYLISLLAIPALFARSPAKVLAHTEAILKYSDPHLHPYVLSALRRSPQPEAQALGSRWRASLRAYLTAESGTANVIEAAHKLRIALWETLHPPSDSSGAEAAR